MAGADRIEAADRAGWRAWLRQNHARATEVWLVYYKKGTGKPSVSYPESVEEAICFGWIDGLKRRIDEERYCHRFSPRKPSSRWTPRNVEIARRMIAARKMTAAGRRAFDRRMEYDPEFLASRQTEPELSAELQQRLKEDRRAWANFEALPPGCRRQYVQWLMSARREDTRQRRLEEAIRLLRRNERLGMK